MFDVVAVEIWNYAGKAQKSNTSVTKKNTRLHYFELD